MSVHLFATSWRHSSICVIVIDSSWKHAPGKNILVSFCTFSGKVCELAAWTVPYRSMNCDVNEVRALELSCQFGNRNRGSRKKCKLENLKIASWLAARNSHQLATRTNSQLATRRLVTPFHTYFFSSHTHITQVLTNFTPHHAYDEEPNQYAALVDRTALVWLESKSVHILMFARPAFINVDLMISWRRLERIHNF